MPIEAQDEFAALSRLREHELELDQKLASARQEAARLLAEARQAAERQRQQVQSELEAEVQRLRQDASQELERGLALIRAENGRKGDAPAPGGRAHRQRALRSCSRVEAGRP
jgi:vacuolar-type H+-ATPase subunit H